MKAIDVTGTTTGGTSDPAIRSLMIDRINSVQIKADFSPSSDGEGIFSLDNYTIELTRGSLKVPSEMSLVHILSHEMSHAIDPCALMRHGAQGSKRKFAIVHYIGTNESFKNAFARQPMGSVHQCLFSEMSLGKKDLDESVNQIMKHVGEADGDAASLAHPFCQLSRFREGFCELMAAEVTARYLESSKPGLAEEKVRAGLHNVSASMCSDFNFKREKTINLSFHPSTQDRVERILMTHPVIRSKAGAKSLLHTHIVDHQLLRGTGRDLRIKHPVCASITCQFINRLKDVNWLTCACQSNWLFLYMLKNTSIISASPT